MAHPAKWINATPRQPLVEVAGRSLKLRLKQVQRYLPLAAERAAEQVEHVHQLRVSSRRAEAAIDMYRELTPEWRAAWIEEQLKHLRRATNDARDDDVFIFRLEKNGDVPAAARLLERVRAHRRQVQQPLIDVYSRLTRKDRFDRRVAKLLKRVRLRGRRKGKQVRFGCWAKQRLQVISREFLAASCRDEQETDSLHRFRIVGKKFRYAVELLGNAFGAEIRKEVYPLLTKLQDRLGAINDHASARDRIDSWLTIDDNLTETKYLQQLLNEERRQLEEAQVEFLAWWTAERESELRSTIERSLAEGAAC